MEINPNGRIPALTDKFTDGKPIRLFESGSIMQYLVDRYDTEHKVSYPRGTREYYEVNSWVCMLPRLSLDRDLQLMVVIISSCGKWVVLVQCRGKLLAPPASC